MNVLEVFDKPMCCSTGICGTEVDQTLLHFAADLQWLEKKGIQVTRINPASQPELLASNQVVREELHKSNGTCLPLIILNQKVVSAGNYPSRAQLAALVGINHLTVDPTQAAPAPCCGDQKPKGGTSSPCCS